jgi:hypothetical protein
MQLLWKGLKGYAAVFCWVLMTILHAGVMCDGVLV